MYCLVRRFLKYDGRFAFPEGEEFHLTNNDILEIQTENGSARSPTDATAYIQELGTYFYVKLVEDCPSVLRLGRLRDGWCYDYSWQPGENPE